MIKTLTAALALTALASLATAAEPVKMGYAELDTVVAGSDYGCTYGCEAEKGNNGWGNGIDPNNPGSDNGSAALILSKTSDGQLGIENPVAHSDGR